MTNQGDLNGEFGTLVGFRAVPCETHGLGNKLCLKNARSHGKSQSMMNMKREREVAYKVHLELIDLGNKICQEAELWKQRLQAKRFPEGPEVTRAEIVRIYNDYHMWLRKQKEFYERFKADYKELGRFFGADAVVTHGSTGNGVGKSPDDPEMLRVMDLVCQESKKKLDLLLGFDLESRFETDREVRVVESTDKTLVVYCHGTKSKPFSKRHQFVAVLEYILNRVEDEGSNCIIFKKEVWNHLLHLRQYSKQTFKLKPEEKTKENIRSSVNRHLRRIETCLKAEFPTLGDLPLFTPSSQEEGFTTRI